MPWKKNTTTDLGALIEDRVVAALERAGIPPKPIKINAAHIDVATTAKVVSENLTVAPIRSYPQPETREVDGAETSAAEVVDGDVTEHDDSSDRANATLEDRVCAARAELDEAAHLARNLDGEGRALLRCALGSVYELILHLDWQLEDESVDDQVPHDVPPCDRAGNTPAAASLSQEEMYARRRLVHAARDESITVPVRERDGDQCRYCGRVVNWFDRKGLAGGCYQFADNIHPSAMVVACGACDRAISAGAALVLSLPPTQPVYTSHTVQWLAQRGVDVTKAGA